MRRNPVAWVSLGIVLFLILTGLPKLRVAGGENFAYGVWAGDFAKGRRLSWVTRRMQNAVTVFHSGYPVLCTLILFALLTGPAQHSLSVSAFSKSSSNSWIGSAGGPPGNGVQ